MMPLDKYPWAEKYGWVKDKYGMTWQLMIDDLSQVSQKINTAFLFSNKQFGKAKEAIDLYISIFPNSTAHHQELYKEGEGQPVGYLKFGHFTLNGELFAAMDGPGEKRGKGQVACGRFYHCHSFVISSAAKLGNGAAFAPRVAVIPCAAATTSPITSADMPIVRQWASSVSTKCAAAPLRDG